MTSCIMIHLWLKAAEILDPVIRYKSKHDTLVAITYGGSGKNFDATSPYKKKKVLIIQRGPLIDPMSSKDDVTSTETIACNSKTAKSISRAIY